MKKNFIKLVMLASQLGLVFLGLFCAYISVEHFSGRLIPTTRQAGSLSAAIVLLCICSLIYSIVISRLLASNNSQEVSHD